jgi:pyruvate formate lyase activating enzyme
MSQAKQFPEIIYKGESWSPKRIVDYCLENKIASIAYTYNEPTVFFEYAYDTMKLAKKNGIKNIRVTNGFMSKECLKKIEKLVDAVNIDIK